MNPEKNDLKIIFMGTSWIAKEALASLLKEKYNVVGVFTQPDRKAGRKQEIRLSPLKELAKTNKIRVFQPEKINEETIREIRTINPDIIIVFAYGKIIPKALIEIPRFKCINIHPSLLPKFRGPSPIQNAILSGKKETGITLMLMDEKVDHGDILVQIKVPIGPKETSEDLTKKVSELSSKLLLEKLPLWIKGEINPKKQEDSKATFCQLIEREDGHIFWNEEAKTIFNKFRAFQPWPGIFCLFEGDNGLVRMKLEKIEVYEKNTKEKFQVGEIIRLDDSKIGVQTANGIIVINEVKMEGKSKLETNKFVNGYPNFIGSILK